jgi:hypothetical protein
MAANPPLSPSIPSGRRPLVIMSYYTLHPRGSLRCVVSMRAHPEISLGFAGRTSFSGATARIDTPRPRPGRPFSNASRRWAGWHKAIAGPAGRQAPPQVLSQARSRGELPPAAQPARWPRASAPRRSAGDSARFACRLHAAPSCRARPASPRPDSAPEGRATPAPNLEPPNPSHRRVFEPPPNPPARAYSAR